MSSFTTSGEIKLDYPRAVFYSGQLVSGMVSFTLTEPLKFLAIDIEYIGDAEVLWTDNIKETQFGQERIKTVEYKANEEYFKYTERLAGGPGHHELPAGPHGFPFKFHIPHTAPSSFKGSVGRISYGITATLIFPYPNVINEALVKEIQVIAPLDLNTGSPDIKKRINLDYEEVYGCECFCSPKPMNIRVSLPVTGYCPGQKMPITVEIDNESSTEINRMIFELIYRERYRSQQPPGEFVPPEQSLVKVKKGAVLGSSKKAIRLDLQVPDMLPPYLDNCSIIDVGYFIKVTFKLSGCNSDLTDEADICLGLVPLKEFTNGPYEHPLKDSLPETVIPDPNKPLEYDPKNFVQPPLNPYLQSQPAPASNYSSNVSVNNMGYPGVNTPYPANSTYPASNSRPSSGSYGFVLGLSPGNPSGGYGSASVNSQGVASPSAPPPYV